VDLEVFYLGHFKNYNTIQYNTILLSLKGTSVDTFLCSNAMLVVMAVIVVVVVVAACLAW